MLIRVEFLHVLFQNCFGPIEFFADVTPLTHTMYIGHVFSVTVVLFQVFGTNLALVLRVGLVTASVNVRHMLFEIRLGLEALFTVPTLVELDFAPHFFWVVEFHVVVPVLLGVSLVVTVIAGE